MNTIKETSRKIIEEPSMHSFYISEFLEDFYSSPLEEKSKMLEEEPFDIEEAHLSAYLAAMAEKLSVENKLPVPDWTRKQKYFLREPRFYGGDKLKATLIIESPVSFRRRNIFVSANALLRA
jgi:hypothetical protein